MRIFILLLAAILVTSVSFAHTIELKNGNIIQGEIIERTREAVKIDIGTDLIVTYYLDEVGRVNKETIVHDQGANNDPFDFNEKADGIHRKYYENGALYVETNYKDGKRNGLIKYYDGIGNLVKEKNYVNDIREGITRSYYENGTIMEEENYKNDEAEGIARYYYEEGPLFIETYYINDKLDGPQKIYNKDGSLQRELIYREEKMLDNEGKLMNGPLVLTYDNKNEFAVENYQDGALNGLRKEYYENGALKIECHYRNGQEYDVGKSYFKNGQLKSEAYYEDGEDQRYKMYDKRGNIILDEAYM